MTECVIAGRFTSEILAMTHNQRSWWYKKLSSEEREMAMQIVKRVRRLKNSEATKQQWKDPAFRENLSGENHSAKRPEVRAKQRVLNSGENNPNWKGGVSFEPYCPAFNISRKEHTRNRYNRVCVVCGKSALQQIVRLITHHVDENKMQGCKDWEWRLAVLCRSCHARMHRQDLTLLLQLLLLNNRWHQTNFLLGVIEP